VSASERLLRKLGLPGDPTVITELRLIVALLIRGAVTAAAAMLETHLGAAMKRMIAQMKNRRDHSRPECNRCLPDAGRVAGPQLSFMFMVLQVGAGDG